MILVNLGFEFVIIFQVFFFTGCHAKYLQHDVQLVHMIYKHLSENMDLVYVHHLAHVLKHVSKDRPPSTQEVHLGFTVQVACKDGCFLVRILLLK